MPSSTRHIHRRTGHTLVPCNPAATGHGVNNRLGQVRGNLDSVEKDIGVSDNIRSRCNQGKIERLV